MRRALLLAWLLAGGAMAAGNFSFDVTSSADDNWVKIAADAAHRLPAVHSYVLSGYAATGVLQMPFHRYLDNQGTASNWFVRATAADLWLLTASSGGVGGAGYDPIGAGATTNFTIVGLSFDSAVSAITYLDGVVGETDTTVAATDNPVQGVRIGCGDTGPGDTCNAANDHRGEIGDVALYGIALTNSEQAQAGAINSYRRPFRGRVGHWQLLGRPGTSMGTVVPDWSPEQLHGDGSAGTDPTYLPCRLRGAGR